MQIRLKQPGQPVADFAVSGTLVSVCGVTVDCAERQQDSATTIEIRQNASGPGEGGQGAYLAQIDIPARRYAYIETLDEGGEGGEGEGRQHLPEPLPLDHNTVVVTLWPVA